MKIQRSDPGFSNYTILRRQRWWQWVWSIVTMTLIPRYAGYEVLKGVLSADDATGMVIRQEEDDRGEPLYVNGSGDVVAIDNTLKVLLLLPELRQHFIAEFIPKTQQTYVDGLVIMYNGSSSPEQLAVIPVPTQTRVEGETIIMEGGYDG